MKPFFLLLFIPGLALAAEVPLDESNSWPFHPGEEPFSDEALLDLRWLNEKQAGESGFIRKTPDGDDFVLGNGEPVRFWAVGTELYRKSPEEMDRHCRFLAKMGVNLARLHARVANTEEGADITDVNEEEIQGIFRFIKAAKENGIYVLISPYYAHHEVPESWDLPAYTGERPWGVIFIEPKMREAYKVWTRELYTRKNPDTGLPIKDDPAVAFLQIHNEDSLFFWTQSGLSEAHKQRLGRHFGDFLKERYGSVSGAIQQWGEGATKHGHDDAAKGVAGVFDIWYLTNEHSGGMARRMRDQTEFMARFQRDFYASMGDHLRDLGCRQILNATNWRTANDEKLKALERFTYHALEFDAENEYVGSDYQHIGENNGYRIDPGHFLVNESVLPKPLELSTNYRLAEGYPFFVTETSWKHPNRYQSEGPFLISAYQSLTGLDAVFWFTCDTAGWNLDPRRTFWRVGDSFALSKWSCTTPMLVGMFPANALQYRRGYIEQGPPAVREIRPLEELWQRKPPAIRDNEIRGDQRNHPALQPEWEPASENDVNPAAFLVGPVRTRVSDGASDLDVVPLSRYFDPKRGTIASNTGQHLWNYRKRFCTLDSPKAQGVTGHLAQAGGRFELSTVTIESSTPYATLQAVSLDDAPLAESRKILLQIGTVARLTGWKTKDTTHPFGKGEDARQIEGEEIVNTGSPPWRIGNIEGSIIIRNPGLSKATRLTPSGYANGEAKLEKMADGSRLSLPPDAMYLILE